jgi:hypothetical protein
VTALNSTVSDSKQVQADIGSRSVTEFAPIQGISQLGYTEREAAFLYEVARCSGYFLRRHYGDFINRERGGLLQSFIANAQRIGHVEVIDCGQRRFLYHLKSKLIGGSAF